MEEVQKAVQGWLVVKNVLRTQFKLLPDDVAECTFLDLLAGTVNVQQLLSPTQEISGRLATASIYEEKRFALSIVVYTGVPDSTGLCQS